MDKNSECKEENKKPTTPPRFEQRFNIKVDADEARKQFLNRVRNSISPYLRSAAKYGQIDKVDILLAVANTLGKRYDSDSDFDDYVGDDFYSCLKALEATYKALPQNLKQEFNEILQIYVISQSEIDLGISWREGTFWPSGAKLLDEALVNEPLQWLSNLAYQNVLAPFKKGLFHFLEAKKYPERLSDTITDMYEALEAMSKVITSRPNKDLSANRELFVNKLGLSDYYKKMLRDYISYASVFRHAVEVSRERVPPLAQEVEAFIYTTGLFIRLAIEQLNSKRSS